MIVFNKKWNEEVLSKALLDIVQPSANPNVYCGECKVFNQADMGLVDGICTKSIQQFQSIFIGPNGGAWPLPKILYKSFNRLRLENFSLVTEKFIKTLDKFYKKLYHEDFTINIFYGQHLLSIFQGLASPNLCVEHAAENYLVIYNKNFGNPQINKTKPGIGDTNEPSYLGINPNDFKIVIDRMIALGLMSEEDRLDIKDQCFLTGLKRANIQIINNTEEKTIDIICNNISDVVPDIKTENLSYKEGVDQTGIGMSVEHAFHKDKRLFLMYTPYLKNETTVKYGNTLTDFVPEEPTTLQASGGTTSYNENGFFHHGPSHEPISYFKPKTYQTRFNKGSMPMATHLIWRIGTQDTRETAITENSPFVPEVIFDHVDRISHIDNFKLRIKYNVVRF